MWKNVLDAFIIIVLAALFVHALMRQNGESERTQKKDDQDARILFLPSTSPGPQNQKFLFTPN